MLLHVDGFKFTKKPAGNEIGGIKSRLTDPSTIMDIDAAQLAYLVGRGYTVQPGITPFSERNRKKGKNGTCDDDFTEQTLFMNDIDNKHAEFPIESPAHVVEVLKPYNLTPALFYDTFNSTPEHERFRFGLVSDEPITDRTERDAIQGALIKAFQQSDPDCINADRIFFGTDKGIIDGAGQLDAVCRKADLLAFAAAVNEKAAQEEQAPPKFGEIIPVGNRHGTLVSFAATVLKKYGADDGKAYELFMQRAAQCAEPKPDDELKKIWRDAVKYYAGTISKQPGYLDPQAYAVKEFEDETDNGKKPKRKKKPISYYTRLAETYIAEHKYIVGVQRLCKGGFGNDTVYEYRGGAWRPRSETDVKSELAKRVISEGVTPDPTQTDKAYKVIVMSGRRKDVETFNGNENLVCFKNGVYRLSDGATLPHDPEYYFTFQLNANIPDEVQPTPYCDLCISNFGGRDVQNLLLQLSGSAMSNVDMSKFKKAVLQVGATDAGKTQMKRLVERIVGDGNYNNVDLSNLENNRFMSAAFQNVRVGGSNDMSNVRITEMKLFKQFTGGDSVQAENKGEKSFTFRFKGLLWFLANQLPLFGGDKSDAVYNRWIVIPCEHSIPQEKQIKDLQDRMFEERDSFCIKALKAFQKAVENNHTFDIPESCKLANDEYRRKNSVVRTFIDECCEPLDRGNAPQDMTTGRFWNLFKRWCADGKFYMPGKSEFKRELAVIAGVDESELVYHNKSGNYYPYIVTADAIKELDPFYCEPLLRVKEW